MNKPGASWLSRIPLIAGAIGILMTLIGLSAPAGIWLGLWEFDTGIRILYNPDTLNVTSVAPWVAGAVALVGIGTLLAGGKRSHAAFALAAAAGAALAYSIPESYRPAPELPLIHDISTDTSDPPVFVDILPLRADAPNTAVYGGGEGQTPESLAAEQHRGYPDIEPQRFDEPPAAVFERAAAAARSLGWEIVAEVPEEGRIEAIDTTFWFRFRDDIVIRIRADGNGSVLDARSVSRVGLSDAGTNAARLRRFFAAL